MNKGIIFGFASYIKAFFILFSHKKLIKASIFPSLINFIVLIVVIIVGFDQYDNLLNYVLPSHNIWWEQILYYLSWIIFPLLFFVILFYCFITIACIISSPFLDHLSKSYMKNIKSFNFKKDHSSFFKIIAEETKKILCLLLIAIIAFPINFIPVVGNILYLFISALLFSFEFLDYPMAIFEWTFKKRYSFIFQNFFTSLGLGIAVTISFIIPFIGFLCLPISTIAATDIFITLNKDKTIDNSNPKLNN